MVQTADAACDAAANAEKKRLNDAKHSRFKRGLEEAPTNRKTNTPRCPPGLAQRILAAGKTGQAQCFAIYADSKEDWAQVEIQVSIADKVKERHQQGKGWFTRADLMEKQHKDSDSVDSIVAEKERLGQWMPHPDSPEDANHRLYHCFDFMTDQSDKEREASTNYQFKTALGQDSVGALKGSIQDVAFAQAVEFPSSSSGPAPLQALCDGSAAATCEKTHEEQTRETYSGSIKQLRRSSCRSKKRTKQQMNFLSTRRTSGQSI